ncbi:YdhK family protein [Bacillus thermotolerans]|uniref:YdhK family protein n=1 Tax=Bacillus thermotolerans TaxID=1221996 RepID=UPI000588F73A|nr:YdhK family protein [Bacillus thermotolerans]
MKNKKFLSWVFTLVMALVLSACAGTDETEPANNDENAETETNESTENQNTETDTSTEEGSGSHENMNHSSTGEVPEGLAKAENPTYPVGSQAVMNANHMPGMDGAVATIEGAFNTTVYSVTYTPTTGGEKVEDHKWVIHEELENAGEQPFQPGDEIVLNADHMEGMDGATAVIDSAEQTTIYMVSYTDTETGDEVTNHKWVTESELSPAE